MCGQPYIAARSKIPLDFFAHDHPPARIGGVPVMFAGVCRTLEVAMDRWTVTVEEAAQVLGISRSSAYECVRRGELRALRLGRRLVVPRAALLDLLEPNECSAPELTEPEDRGDINAHGAQ
jgi:excisionase family DNA binding protein